MAVYRCRFCGSMYDEEKEGVPVGGLKVCPVCRVAADKLVRVDDVGNAGETVSGAAAPGADAAPEAGTAAVSGAAPAQAPSAAAPGPSPAPAYDPEYARVNTDSRFMDDIHEMAVSGRSIIAAMGTRMPMPGWDDILILGAQLNPPPLDEHAPVSTRTVIGKHAKQPMVLEHPVYISHMSFGALSKETKVALAQGSAMARTAMCSGEGGILPEEMDAAYKYIFEYVPNLYSVTTENLRRADAIEIKIGQGTKPGMGGSYCAKLESQPAFGLLAAGNLFSATFRFASLSGTASFGMPYQWTARPTALRLKYHATVGAVNKGTVTEEHEYIQDGQDRSRIFAVIVDWNSRHATVAGMGSPTGVWDPAKTAETAEGPVIAYGSLLIGETTPGDAMTTVEIPIEYYDRTTKPTGAYTLIISCTTSAYGDFKVGCLGNVMYVDDFEWVY